MEMAMVPFGFRFNPTDEELLQILERKVFHNDCHLDFITETNIYDHEPQYLQWDEKVAVNKGEKYYFCRREVDSREVARRGWWKATSHVKTINDGSGHRVVGFKRPLTFHKFNKHDGGGDMMMNMGRRRRRNNPVKTDWIMHEYTLDATAEWRLCRIKYKGKLQGEISSDYEEKLQPQTQLYCSSNHYSNDSGGAPGAITSKHDQLDYFDAGVCPQQPFDLSSDWEFVDSILDLQQYSLCGPDNT